MWGFCGLNRYLVALKYKISYDYVCFSPLGPEHRWHFVSTNGYVMKAIFVDNFAKAIGGSFGTKQQSGILVGISKFNGEV
jgi:hypothetical protein